MIGGDRLTVMEEDWDWPFSLEEAMRGGTEWVNRRIEELQMFDPPLQGSLLAGRVIIRVPFSDIKYKDFLEWWFAVGRKAPELTAEGWATMVGPYAAKGLTDIISQEDWDRLPEGERVAISRWADRIKVGIHYSCR